MEPEEAEAGDRAPESIAPNSYLDVEEAGSAWAACCF